MTRQVPLSEFLANHPPESQGPDWTWEQEMRWMRCEDGDYFTDLVDDIRVNGIRNPVTIGTDGRLWDGHHRVCAAITLRLPTIPVEILKEESDAQG